MNKIPLAIPHMGGYEIDYVQDAFTSNWVAPIGPNIDLFEKWVREYTGASYSLATSSGTAAIHLALKLIGVKEHDVVFCSTFTFIASANPIIYQNATPVFIDSELDTWNMSPIALEKALIQFKRKGKLPKAIIVAHIYGQPAKMSEILELSKIYDVPVIEDAAESLGSKYKNKETGTLGDMGIYSFNGNKIITTSGGGMLVSANKDYILKGKFLSTQAKEPFPYYQHEKIGYNYRLSNISAGIGCGQMIVLPKRIAKKREIYQRYCERFSEISGIRFQKEIEDTFSNRWLTAIQFKGLSPLVLQQELEKQNVESRPLWKPLHMQPVFKNETFVSEFENNQRSNAEYLFSSGLCLPSATQMTETEQDYVIETCLFAFKKQMENR